MKKTWPLFNRLVALSAAVAGLVACGGGNSGSSSNDSQQQSSASLTVNSQHSDSGAASLELTFAANANAAQAQLLIESLSDGHTVLQQPLPLECDERCTASWRGLITNTKSDNNAVLRIRVDYQQQQQVLNILQDMSLEVGECLRNSDFYKHHVQPELQQHCISCHGLGSQGVFDPRWEWSQFSRLIDEYGDFLHEFPSQNTQYTLLGEVIRHPVEALPESQPGYAALVNLVQRQQQGFDCP